MRSRLLPLLLLPVLALGTLAGCGDEGPSDASGTASDPTPSPTAASETPTSPTSPLPTMTLPTAPPSTPSDSFQRVKVSGTVSDVDGCLVLTDGNGVTWELRGPGLDSLQEGQQVVVNGKGLPGEGTCGAPLSVTSIEVTAN